MPKAASNKSSIKSHFKSTKDSSSRQAKSTASKHKSPVVEISDEDSSDLDENSKKWDNLHKWALQRMEFDEPLHSANKTKVDIILRVFE